MSRRARRRRLGPWLAVLLAAALLAPGGGRARAAATPSRERTVDVEHYRLALRVDERRGEVAGTAAVTFRPLGDALRELVLDAAGLAVTGVTLEPVGTQLAFRLDPTRETLSVDLGRPFGREDRLTVAVAYSARPSKGLYFYPGDPAEPARPAQFWSQGEAADNHFWFPCWDSPDDKATSSVELTVNGRFTTVSNGELVSTAANADGTRTFVWDQRLPHAAYLISVVGGEFLTIDGGAWRSVPIRYVVPPALADRVARSLGRTPAMMEYFAGRLGEFPWAKYSQAVVANFPLGGMENTSATTLSESALLDERAAVDASTDELVAHELAHQWFGDFVTCHDWSHVWLHEGFATYLALAWVEESRGRDEYLYGMRRQAYERELVEGTPKRPLVPRAFRGADDVLLRSPVYSKGAWVVHMLRRHLGEALFWRGVRAFLARNAFGTATTDDLRVALEGASGQQLDWFFDQWVRRPGHPDFVVSTAWDPSASTLRLTLVQRQDRSGDVPVFRGAAPVVIVTAAGRRVERVWFDSDEASFAFRLDGPPLMVSFDPEADLLRTVAHDKTPAELEYQLANDAVPGRMWAAEQLGARKDARSLAALSGALARDPFFGVREAAARQLWRFGSEPARAALRRATRDRDPRVRAAAASGLGDPSRASRGVLRSLAKSDPSDAVAAAALGALVAGRDPSAFDTLARALASRSRGDAARAAALLGMERLGDRRSLPFALAWSEAGRPASARLAALALLGGVGAGDPRAGSRAREALSDARPAVRAAAAEAASRLLGAAALPALEAALAREKDPGARAAILRAVERLRKAPPARGISRRGPGPTDTLARCAPWLRVEACVRWVHRGDTESTEPRSPRTVDWRTRTGSLPPGRPRDIYFPFWRSPCLEKEAACRPISTSLNCRVGSRASSARTPPTSKSS